MKKINVYVKNRTIRHGFMDFKTFLRLFNRDFRNFKGKYSEFIFVDMDEKKILSSQNCFDLMDLDEKTTEKIVKNYDYKEL